MNDFEYSETWRIIEELQTRYNLPGLPASPNDNPQNVHELLCAIFGIQRLSTKQQLLNHINSLL